MKSQTSSKLDHVGSKTRSLGQILEKSIVPFRGLIFSPILMKLGQNVCPNEISDEFEIWSCWFKNLVTRPNLRKTLLLSRGHIFSLILTKLGQHVCLDKILDLLEIGSCWVKN